MSEPLPIERQRRLLHDLLQLIADTAHLQAETEDEYRTRSTEAQQQYEAARDQLRAQHQARQEAAEHALVEARTRIVTHYQTRREALKRDFTTVRDVALSDYTN